MISLSPKISLSDFFGHFSDEIQLAEVGAERSHSTCWTQSVGQTDTSHVQRVFTVAVFVKARYGMVLLHLRILLEVTRILLLLLHLFLLLLLISASPSPPHVPKIPQDPKLNGCNQSGSPVSPSLVSVLGPKSCPGWGSTRSRWSRCVCESYVSVMWVYFQVRKWM